MPGVQWVEATLDNGMTVSGPNIDVRVAEEPSFSQKLFGDVNPLIGSVTALLLVAVVVTLLAWMRRMTVNSGSKSDYDWDEYSSEFEDDYEDDYDDEDDDEGYADVASTPLPRLLQPFSSAEDEETDWVVGADGYWWYHDKATNEWWYKDANDTSTPTRMFEGDSMGKVGLCNLTHGQRP